MGEEPAERVVEPDQEDLDQFDQLVPRAAQLHELTWCVKRQWTRFTDGLRAEECMYCPHFVLRGGVCDPL